jgi:hypothetical protein
VIPCDTSDEDRYESEDPTDADVMLHSDSDTDLEAPKCGQSFMRRAAEHGEAMLDMPAIHAWVHAKQ